jgi:hypothetical protein
MHFKIRIYTAVDVYIKQVIINIVTWTKKITSLFIYLFFNFSSKKKKKKRGYACAMFEILMDQSSLPWFVLLLGW